MCEISEDCLREFVSMRIPCDEDLLDLNWWQALMQAIGVAHCDFYRVDKLL